MVTGLFLGGVQFSSTKLSMDAIFIDVVAHTVQQYKTRNEWEEREEQN
jgi:hypothetical protein